jgi:hypothetical protein
MSIREEERRRAAARELRQQQLMSAYNMPRPNIDYRKIASDAYENMSTLDKAALVTSPLPIVGDIVGGVADAVELFRNPTLLNAGLFAAGLLPFVPSGGVTRNLRQALVQAPNDLPYFYSGRMGAQPLAAAGGAARGMRNLVEARYSPRARGLFAEQGVSVADTKAAKKALKEFQDPDVGTDAGKKVIGQFRQSTLMGEQYKNPSKFHKISEGLDEVAFGKFSAKEYSDIMGGATGLRVNDFNAVFDEIKKVQKVDPRKNYQMTVRRTNTQAAGNLDRFAYKRPIFGGSTITGLKKNVFKGNKFKTDKEFLEALQANKVGVRNPEGVLKGRPAIVTGSVVSDARELGGVNYMTAIKKDGTLVSFMNDEHDLFKMKLPKGDRMINVSTPITIDLLKKTDSPQRVSPKVARSKETLLESRKAKAKEVEKELSKYSGVDTSLKTPPGMSKAQFYAVQAVANMRPDNPDYSRILKDAGLFGPTRTVRAVLKSDEEEEQ